jgi:hypothetical protein
MRPIERQWWVLKQLPRAPRLVDAAGIQRALAREGIAVSRRTIERDLIMLSRIFPITCDDEHKPYGWAWAREA